MDLKLVGVRWAAAALMLAGALSLGACQAEAMEVKLRAQLIWGTNGDRPKGGEYKELTGKLKEKLARVFKWKNYYQVKDQPVAVKPGETQRVKMNDQCELELRVVDDFTLEVRLFGEGGALIQTLRQPLQAMRQGELAVLAGDSKERSGDAWFVVLSVPRK